MTRPLLLPRIQYDCNGVVYTFGFDWKIFVESDLGVKLTDANGVDTLLTLNTHYTVAGAGDETGGSITTQTTYSSGYKITLYSVIPITQDSDYIENDPFPAASHEAVLDRIVAIEQQISEALGRAALFPVTSDHRDVALPVLQPNQILGTDASATAIVMRDPAAVLSLPIIDHIGNYSNDLATAVAAIGAGEQDLYVNVANNVTADLTVPENIHLIFPRGGLITLTPGKLLNIGRLDAGEYQIFNTQGYRDLVAYYGDTDPVLGPEPLDGWLTRFTDMLIGRGPIRAAWWGNDQDAFQRAVYAAAEGQRVIGHQGAVTYTGTVYMKPELGVTLELHGGTITHNVDGVLLDVHRTHQYYSSGPPRIPGCVADVSGSDARSYHRLRQVRLLGGRLVNTAAAKTASVGVRAYSMSHFHMEGVGLIQNFWTGLEIAPCDTFVVSGYRFLQNYYADIVYANWATKTHLIQCHIKNNDFTFKPTVQHYSSAFFGPYTDVSITDNTYSGEIVHAVNYFENPAPLATDPNDQAWDTCEIARNHYEQGTQESFSKVIWFHDVSSGARDYRNITIRKNTFPAIRGTHNIYLENCRWVKIEDNDIATNRRNFTDGVVVSGDATFTSATGGFTSGSADVVAGMFIICRGVPMGTKVLSVTNDTTLEMTANATASYSNCIGMINRTTPLYLDSRCTEIQFGQNFYTAGTLGIVYECDRSEISFVPSWRPLATPRVIWNAEAHTTDGSPVQMRMDAELGAAVSADYYPREMAPRSYKFRVRMQSTTSATAINNIVFGPTSAHCVSSDELATVFQIPQGTANNSWVEFECDIHCNSEGDIYYQAASLGSGTITAYIWCLGWYM